MSHPSTCQTADFFVLRSPGLPQDALTIRAEDAWNGDLQEQAKAWLERDREALRKVVRDLVRLDIVQEALALASPDLAAQVGPWLDGTLKVHSSQNVERSLLKYISRMSHRSTPFGLFAGVSMGAWSHVSQLGLASWKDCRKSMRLDWGVLETLVDGLDHDPAIRPNLEYHVNTSLYAHGAWVRYLEKRDQEGEGRSYHLEAVEATPHLDAVLRRAQNGARQEELSTELVRGMDADPTEAKAFLHRLIDAQLLHGGLHPPLTCPDPLAHVMSTLQKTSDDLPRMESLVTLVSNIKVLQDKPLGTQPKGYPDLLSPLGVGVFPPEVRNVFQVDLFRPAPNLALSPRVRQALEVGAETLRQLTPPREKGPLDRFRMAFDERYGTQWMPLLEVLDEESGIGFDGAPPMDNPLLKGLDFQPTVPHRGLSNRDLFLMAQMPRWQGSNTWELDDSDLKTLSNPNAPPFPASFAALTCLSAAKPSDMDRGDFQFWMEHYSGPTAARWLGRFASGDPELEAALRSHLRGEESFQPEAVFAEVVHVPEGRLGNVLARPALRDYEIPFLSASGVPADRTLLPSDLSVTVRGNRIFLASKRLGREVIPRLASAHNFTRGPVVYRFLAHLQDQDGMPGGWSWGALAELPFLPRVSLKKHVLSKAHWKIDARELVEAMAISREGAWGAFQSLRAARGLPRHVLLAEADNTLRVDLDRVLWAETLHHLVSNRPSFTLTECFPDPAQALVTSPEGFFAHELVIPFEAKAQSPFQALPPLPGANGGVKRAFTPGSEWLYLKLYCGPLVADHLLLELEPLLRKTQGQGLWDRWHFIRYKDPANHLRIRFHGIPNLLLTELLPVLHTHLEQARASGTLWKWQIDTFEPELERFGGSVGLGLAEAWFYADSRLVLKHLVEDLTQEDRWKIGLRNTDAIWASLGLSLSDRKHLAQASRDQFRKEFGDSGEGSADIGTKFRTFRKELETAFLVPMEPANPSAFDSLGSIRSAIEGGSIHVGLPHMAGTLSHLHLNRMLRTNHREQEWVVMEFLTRLYDSQLARCGG